MPHLTSEDNVASADADSDVILARGLSTMQMRALAQRQTDEATAAPTEDEAIAQVGEMPCFGTMIEFTTNQTVANQFGTGGYVITVRIKRKYLTKGSVSEAGWICRATAPFEVEDTKRGRGFL